MQTRRLSGWTRRLGDATVGRAGLGEDDWPPAAPGRPASAAHAMAFRDGESPARQEADGE